MTHGAPKTCTQYKNDLLMYDSINSGVLKTASYSASGPGGWDISSGANWLSFLRGSYGNMPVDPTNTGVGDPGQGYELTYFYYCYNAGTGAYASLGQPYVGLGYYSEQSHAEKIMIFTVNNCL